VAIDHLRAHELAAPMAAERRGPLASVRILDLTHAIAGPWSTMMLADMGAEVIKVEPPQGEMQRFMGPFTREDPDRAYGGTYGAYNRNKRCIVLDLSKPEDKDTLLKLVDWADALVENQRAGVLDSQGLGYEALRERNPRLVYGAIRGFGDPRTGASPYADWPAYDVIAQAMSSFVSMNGEAGGAPHKVGPFLGDIYPGTVGALGILAAIFHARVTGEGQFVDVSMVDAVTALSETGVTRFSFMGRDTPPSGNSSDTVAPFDIFQTKDGACAIAAPTNKAWVTLANAIGRPELADDERTATMSLRVRNRAVVDEAVAGWAAAHTNTEVLAALGGKVPCGPMNSPVDLFTDPHVQARGMLVAVDQPQGRPIVQVNTPMRFTETPTGIYRRPPVLGEHTDEILAELADGTLAPRPAE
jgi:crotonobetainyl-CoA:carnitine CoA-transferase CaiB-like acyl-CoA transferase